MLPSVGFLQSFPWLHWTIFRDHFVSHHYGFHVMLAPFAWLSEKCSGELFLGGKVFTVLAMGATTALIATLLRILGVRQRAWWLLLVCCLPWHFWLRLSYVRAPVVGLPLLLLAVVLILRDRRILLGLLAFVFTHVYGGVVLFPLIPLAFFLGHVLAGTCSRAQWWHLAATLAGIVAGLVLSPYFPDNLAFLRTQVFETGLGAPGNVGREWQPLNGWFLLRMSGVLAVVWFACLVTRLRRAETIDGRSLGLLLLNVGFLILTIKSRRFVEYWPVFALLNAADFGRGGLGLDFRPGRSLSDWRRRLRSIWAWASTGALLLAALVTLLVTRGHVRPKADWAALGSAMRHLAEASPRRSLVLTDDWDIFPVAFYYDTHNTYAVGLDPVFTQRKYPVLWERYRLITRGETPCFLDDDSLGDDDDRRVTLGDISRRFGAEYVLIEADHPRLYGQLQYHDDQFEMVFPPTESKTSDVQPAFSIFRVLSPQATP